MHWITHRQNGLLAEERKRDFPVEVCIMSVLFCPAREQEAERDRDVRPQISVATRRHSKSIATEQAASIGVESTLDRSQRQRFEYRRYP